MPANTLRKYRTVVNLLEDLPGGDRAQDLLRVELQGTAPNVAVDTNIEEVGGTAQTGADWTPIFEATRDAAQLLDDAVQSNALDELRVRVFGLDAGGSLKQANAERFDFQLGTGDVGVATYSARALRTLNQDHQQTVIHGLDQGGTLQEVGVEAFNSAAPASGFALLTYGGRALHSQAQDEFRSRVFGPDAGGMLREANVEALNVVVGAGDFGLVDYSSRALNSVGEDELVSRITDSGGVQVDPAEASAFPEQEQQQDLTAGDLTIGPVSVAKQQAVLIAANSTDEETWSASVIWRDSAGNRVMQQDAADVGLQDVIEDDARLRRKGAQVEVTFTDTSGGAANNVNAFVDAHR